MLNSESRTKNAGKNIVSALMNKICVLMLTFLGRKVFIHYVGVEYLGINGLFSNILTLLSMADLGLGTAINVSLYKPIAENDTAKISALLYFFRKIYYMIAAAVTVIGLALIPALPVIVNLDSDIPYLHVYYMVFVLKNTVSYLFVYKSSIISANQKKYLINRIDVYINVLRVFAQIISVVLLKKYLIYILIDLLSVIVHNLVVSRVAEKQYPFLKEKRDLPKEEKAALVKDIYSAFLYKVSGSILNGTDNLLISILIGTIAVGLYSNYYTITYNIEAIITLLFTSLTAGVGNLIATSDSKKRYGTFRIMQMVGNWLGSCFSICLFFLVQDFIVLWLNEDMLLDSYVLAGITMNLYYAISMYPVWTFREGTGMYRQIRYIMFLTAALNIVLSIMLGKWIGLGGILIATPIAKFATCFFYEPYILFRRFFCIKAIHYFRDYLGNIVFTGVCGICCFMLVNLIEVQSYATWIGKAITCTAVVNVLCFIRYHRTQEFRELKRKLIRIKEK